MPRSLEVVATSTAAAIGAVLAALAVGANVLIAVPATLSVAVVAMFSGRCKDARNGAGSMLSNIRRTSASKSRNVS